MRPAQKGTRSRVAAQRAQVSNAVGVLVREFLDAGLPYDKAVQNAALGTHRLHEVLTASRVKICRRTVHTRLGEMYGAPVGRMPRHQHEAVPGLPLKVWWLGANTYDLYRDRTRRGERLLSSLSRYDQKLSLRRGHIRNDTRPVALRSDTYYSDDGVALRANLVEEIVGGLLDWAISHSSGQRNNLGNWLAWRCRAKGLGRDEVEQVVDRYQEEVCFLGSHPYGRREAMATVGSVFRR